MNRISVTFLLLLLYSSGTTIAQTYYYKLVKVVQNNIPLTNVSGGQFITFIADICYESDKKGIGVGHGTLVRNSGNDKQIKVYMGESYWGDKAIFKFTSDLATLNVVTENGNVYLYKHTTAPANVTTCSLIRKNTSSSGLSRRNAGGGYSDMPSQPVFNGGGGASTTPIKTIPEKNTPTKVWHECGLCHGKRTIVRESSVSTFGQDTQWYCNQCGRNVWRSSGHSHVNCSQCGGQGGYYTTQ